MAPADRGRRDESRGVRRASLAERAAGTSQWSEIVRRIEWAIFGVGCVLVVGLQAILYRHAGAFWRDETTTLHVAGLPSFVAMWSSLSLDSFPGLFVSTLRAWIRSGLGATDDRIRLFGTVIALAIVPTVLFCCRQLRDDTQPSSSPSSEPSARAPLLALALVPLNPSVFYYGSSIRAYGLATIFILLAFAFLWDFTRRPSRRTWALATIFALLSVHSTYQNSPLLLAVGVAGAAACLAFGDWKRGVLALVPCVLAALSLVIYVPVIRSYRADTGIGTESIRLTTVASRFAGAIAGDGSWLLALWMTLALMAVWLIVARSLRARSEPRRSGPSLSLFCAVTVLVAAAAGVIFFEASGNLPWSWHFIPFLALAGVIIEIGIRPAPSSLGIASLRVLLACAVIAVSLPGLWKLSHLRRTNIDIVSATLSTSAAAGDLIVVNPFWYSPSFHYYYRGKADWMTLPPIPTDDRSRVGPFGAYRKLMATPNALAPAMRRIEATLTSGNTVWIVGTILFLPPGATPPVLSVAPDPEFGWRYEAYSHAWTMQMGHALQRREDITFSKHPFAVDQPVNPLEDIALTRIEVDR